jgi:acetolactate synthase-1/2/3 large subunit
VLVTSKNQDLFPGKHENWAGSLGFFGTSQHKQLIDDADLVLAVGTRLGDITTLGWSVLQGEQQRLVHVYPDPAQINRHYAPDLAIVADAGDFLAKLAKRPGISSIDPSWLQNVANVRDQTDGWHPERVPPEDVIGRTFTAAASLFGPHDIVTGDSGNFAAWVHRAFRFREGNRYISTSCGAMGMGVPAAVAAAMRYPDRTVFAFCGDGGFLMNGNDFITACARGLNVKVFVSNNRSYGTIRTHQQRAFPGRTSGTDLHNPDFAAMAVAFGAKGYIIDKSSDIANVVTKAVTSQGPAIIDVRSDVEYSVQKSMAAQKTT